MAVGQQDTKRGIGQNVFDNAVDFDCLFLGHTGSVHGGLRDMRRRDPPGWKGPASTHRWRRRAEARPTLRGA
jgi:hypothetical protein